MKGTFHFNFSIVHVNYLFNIAQTQSKSFNIMYISGWYPVKTIKNLGMMLFRNSNAIISNTNDHIVVFIGS